MHYLVEKSDSSVIRMRSTSHHSTAHHVFADLIIVQRWVKKSSHFCGIPAVENLVVGLSKEIRSLNNSNSLNQGKSCNYIPNLQLDNIVEGRKLYLSSSKRRFITIYYLIHFDAPIARQQRSIIEVLPNDFRHEKCN